MYVLIYTKFILRQAEPRDQLQKRYQQFQRRLARHYLNIAEETAAAEEAGPHPTARQETVSRGRNVLDQLSRAQSQSSLRTSSQSTSGLVIGGKNGSIPKTKIAPSNKQFQVLSDENSTKDTDLIPENPNWKYLAPIHIASKENNLPIQKWSEGVIPSTNTQSSSTSTLRSTQQRPVFAIFEDEVEKDSKKLSATEIRNVENFKTLKKAGKQFTLGTFIIPLVLIYSFLIL